MGPSIVSPITHTVPSLAQSACRTPRPPGAGNSDVRSQLDGPSASQSGSMDVRGTHASADVDHESNDRWQQWQEERQRESSSVLEPTPKRLRGSYRCRRCGQPKKGHVCPLTSPSPAPPYARRPCQSNPHHVNTNAHPPNHSQSVNCGDPSCGGACGNTRDCSFDSPSGLTRADMRKPGSCGMGNMQPLRLPDASAGPPDSATAYTADGGRSSACQAAPNAHISLTAPALTASCRSLPSGMSDSNFSFPQALAHANAHGAITSRMAPQCSSAHSLPPLSHPATTCATQSALRAAPSGVNGSTAPASVRPAVQRSPQDMCMLTILAKLPPRDLLSASSCCRRWRRLAAEIWGHVEAASLSLDATPSLATDALVYVPFMLRRCPRLVHLSLQAARCVDDRLLHRIAAEQPHLESLVLRTSPNVACHITDNGMGALLLGCPSLRAVDLDGCIALPALTVDSPSLTSLTVAACARLSRLSLACPALQHLSLSLLPASAPSSANPPVRTCSQTHAHGSAHMGGDPAHAEAVVSQVAALASPLDRLHIASPHTTDAMVAALVRTHGQSLCALSITHSTALTDEGVAGICRSCPHLQLLDLSASPNLSDASLHAISASLSHSLTHLLLAACPGITLRGVQSLVQQLPHLEVLDVGHSLLAPAATAGGEGRRLQMSSDSLRKLSLWGCSLLQTLVLDCPLLEHLNVNLCTALHPSAYGSHLSCPSLRRIVAVGCPVLPHTLLTARSPAAEALAAAACMGDGMDGDMGDGMGVGDGHDMGDGMGNGLGNGMGDGMGMGNDIGDDIDDGMCHGMGNDMGMGNGMGGDMGMGECMGDVMGPPINSHMGNGMISSNNPPMGDAMGAAMSDRMGAPMGGNMGNSLGGNMGNSLGALSTYMGGGMNAPSHGYVGQGMNGADMGNAAMAGDIGSDMSGYSLPEDGCMVNGGGQALSDPHAHMHMQALPASHQQAHMHMGGHAQQQGQVMVWD